MSWNHLLFIAAVPAVFVASPIPAEDGRPVEGNMVFALTLKPAEDGSLSGRLFPIAEWREGTYSNPLKSLVSRRHEALLSYAPFAVEVWSATYERLGELTVCSEGKSVGTVRVSGATSEYMPDGLFVYGQVTEASNPALRDLFDRLRPNEWPPHCDFGPLESIGWRHAVAVSRPPRSASEVGEVAEERWADNETTFQEICANDLRARVERRHYEGPEGPPVLVDRRAYDLDGDGTPEIFAKFAWGGFYSHIWARCHPSSYEVLHLDSEATMEGITTCENALVFPVDIDGDGVQEVIVRMSTDYNDWYEVYRYEVPFTDRARFILVTTSLISGC